jgi:hypothetical protein
MSPEPPGLGVEYVDEAARVIDAATLLRAARRWPPLCAWALRSPPTDWRNPVMAPRSGKRTAASSQLCDVVTKKSTP